VGNSANGDTFSRFLPDPARVVGWSSRKTPPRSTVNHPQLSVQLYTVREAMAEDVAGTLQKIADIGFTQVEPYNFADVPGLAEALAAAGLTAPTHPRALPGVRVQPSTSASSPRPRRWASRS